MISAKGRPINTLQFYTKGFDLQGECLPRSCYLWLAGANTIRADASDWGQFEAWCDERGLEALPARSIGAKALTRPGVVTILRRRIFEAIDLGLVDLDPGREGETVPALSAHSFRVGLPRDLFAAEQDGAGIALALRYARELAGGSNAAARVLGKLRAAADPGPG